MSSSSPDKDFFASVQKPYQVKGAALDTVLNVGNNMRIDLMEGQMYNELDTIYKRSGFLKFVNDGSGNPSTFLNIGTITVTTAQFSGGTAYIDGRRFEVPTTIVSITNGLTNYIYIDITGEYVSSTSRPSAQHIQIAVIGSTLKIPTNDPNDSDYGTSWYCHVWGNGYQGTGTFNGISLAYKDFGFSSAYRSYDIDVYDVNLGITGYGTVTINNDFTVTADASFTGNLDVTGDLTITGDFTQVDISTTDKFIMGVFDQVLMGDGGASQTPPLGDYGFQFADHAATQNTVDANEIGVLGLHSVNTRLIVTTDADLTTATNANFRAFLNVANLSATTNPDIIFSKASIVGGSQDNIYSQLNYSGLSSGSSNTDGTYGLKIYNRNTSVPLGMISDGAINLLAGDTFDITLTTGTTGTINLTSAEDFQITAAGTGASLIQTTSAALDIKTITSGILTLTSAEALNLNSADDSSWISTSANLTISTATAGVLDISSAALLTLDGTTIEIQDAGTTYWQFNGDELKGLTTSGSRYISSYDGQDLFIRATGTGGDLRLQTTGTGSVYITGTNIFADSVNVGAHDHDGTAAGGTNIVWSNVNTKPRGIINLFIPTAGVWIQSANAQMVSATVSNAFFVSSTGTSFIVYNFRSDFGYNNDTDCDFAVWHFRMPYDFVHPPSGGNVAFRVNFRTFQETTTLHPMRWQMAEASDDLARADFNSSKTVSSGLLGDYDAGVTNTSWRDLAFTFTSTEMTTFGLNGGERLSFAMTPHNIGAGHDMNFAIIHIEYSRGSAI